MFKLAFHRRIDLESFKTFWKSEIETMKEKIVHHKQSLIGICESIRIQQKYLDSLAKCLGDRLLVSDKILHRGAESDSTIVPEEEGSLKFQTRKRTATTTRRSKQRDKRESPIER